MRNALGKGVPISVTNLVIKTLRHSSLCAINVSGHRQACSCGNAPSEATLVNPVKE